MLVWMRQVFTEYLRQRWFLILFVTVFFAMGIFFGATAAKYINNDQAHHLSAYLDSFLEKILSVSIGEHVYFRHNVLNNVYLILVVYFLGLTVIGIPLVMVAIFTRGFILGFTVGFLIRDKAVKGFLFALVTVLPHNLLVIPAVIAAAVTAITFSGILLKRRFQANNPPIGRQLGVYTLSMSFFCLMTGIAAVIETYITPILIKTAANYIR